MNNKLLSIIIPVYNVENYLPICLDSIVKDPVSGSEQVEVIIVDDGSTDSSGRIADEFAGKHPFIHVIHRENKGVAFARNAGMKAALGEWIYFADSDDWLAEDGISYICRRIRQYSNADIILFDAYQNIDSREVVWEHYDSEMVWQDRKEIRALQREALYFHQTSLAAPWDKVYRRSFLEKNHIIFQEPLKVLDDMVFNVEAFGAANMVVYCKDRIYHYRYVEASITNSYKPDRVEQDMQVWSYLTRYISELFGQGEWSTADREALRQAYYCRVIKSFSICCRLCFFSRQNQKSIREQIRYLKEVLILMPYREAFANVKLHYAEWKLKIVILMGRMRMGYGIYLLHVAETFARSRKMYGAGE